MHDKKIIENIFKINLKIKKSERLLIYTDDKSRRLISITKKIAEISRSFCSNTIYLKYKATDIHGSEPPEEAWSAAFGENTVNEFKKKKILSLLINKKIGTKSLKEAEKIVKRYKKEAVNAIVALSYHSTSHTRFRNFLTSICRTRFASMPIFEESMIKTAMSVDWKKMERRTIRMAERVNAAEEVEITVPNGTEIACSIKGRKAKADTGIITKPGSFSNLPAGEVFLAPLEGTANGRLVLDRAPTRKLKNPVTIYIKKGMAEKVTGKEPFVKQLRDKLSERRENRNVAELGIGTNDKASKPDNILETEKIFGTIHIALGDNSSFGGKVSTPFHQDFIFFKPTLTLIHKNGKKDILLKDGELKRRRKIN
jgi:aminopeptidase